MLSDTTGLRVDRPVTWQAQELPSSGIQVVDNKVTFTVAGTFHVRAVVGGVYSRIAVGPSEAQACLDRDRGSFEGVDRDPDQRGGSATVDLTKLSVVAKDQVQNSPSPRDIGVDPSGPG